MTTKPSSNVRAQSAPLSPAQRWLRAIALTANIELAPSRLLADVVHEWANVAPEAIAIVADDESLTYAALSARINRYARWALANGVQRGDVVCMMMPNCADYLPAWLGITQAGGVAALMNVHLVGASLAHCIDVPQPSHIFVAEGLQQAFADAAAHLRSTPRLWVAGAARSGASLDAALGSVSDAPLSADERPPITVNDIALLIYTSGTTGLPKAARVSHRRVMNWAHWFAGLTAATAEDRMYSCLPLYHSVGGVVATGSMLAAGGSVVIAERFSARRFWADIRRHDCTLFQYIGELCRYLLQQPPSPDEAGHRLRLICGNGLRGDIWDSFQSRFAIPQVLEFYASTEGNFSLFNVEGKVGAVGRIPKYLAHRFPAALVRFDVGSGEPARDNDGRCIACLPGEPGEAIGRISGAQGANFEGYTSERETERKILRDVFAPGDAWFRTGDLMTLDAQGFFHFVDRIGDTFRWKGENVAASEVAEVLLGYPGIVEAIVYGVSVPGADGRAGMAALVTVGDFRIGDLFAYLAERLPAYACPVAVRLQTQLAVTETFKPKKQALIDDGFDPARIADPLYLRDPAAQAYVALTAERYQAVLSGALRL